VTSTRSGRQGFDPCQGQGLFSALLRPEALASYSVIISYRRQTPWTGDQPVTRPLPTYRTTQTQNKHIHTPNIHAFSGIRTHDPSVRASEDSSCFRQRGYCDWPLLRRSKCLIVIVIIIIIIQFNSCLFTCKLSSTEANYKVSTST
jgi:hypothetical protein